MLSPKTNATCSEPMKSRPIRKACGSPPGFGWVAYRIEIPRWLAVTQQSLKLRHVRRCGDQQDVPNACQHQCRQRVVDHRLVVNRQQLLVHDTGDGIEATARAACEDDTLSTDRKLVHVTQTVTGRTTNDTNHTKKDGNAAGGSRRFLTAWS